MSWNSEVALGARDIGVPKGPVRPQLSPTTVHCPQFFRENQDQYNQIIYLSYVVTYFAHVNIVVLVGPKYKLSLSSALSFKL